MPKSITLSALETRVRYLTNKINATNAVSQTEIFSWLNTDLDLLYSKIVDLDVDRYLTSSSQAVTSGTASYTLPTDFFLLKGIDVLTSGTLYKAMKPFVWDSRNNQSGGTIWDIRYNLRAGNLVLSPTPTVAMTLRIWYIPTRADIVSAGTFDGINGWEEWAVLSSAIRVRQKENSSALEFERERDRIEKMIIQPLASNRDLGEPSQIRDVLRVFDEYGETEYLGYP